MAGTSVPTIDTQPETTATDQAVLPQPAPSVDETIEAAMQEAGIENMSGMTKEQATAFHKLLRQALREQTRVPGGESTEGLDELVDSLEQAISQWPQEGQTVLEKELDRQNGLLGVLEAISTSVGNGEVGPAGQVSDAQTEVGSKASALEKALSTIDQQMPLGGENDRSAPEQAQRILDSINELEQTGFNLDELQLGALRQEIQQSLSMPAAVPPNPTEDNLALRKSVLGALDNYFKASGLTEESPQRMRNKALLEGTRVEGNEYSLKDAWETEARSITNLKSFNKKNLEGATTQLEALRDDAIRRGDAIAVAAINAKITVMAGAVDHVDAHGSLGDHSYILAGKLKAIDLGTKHVLLDQLKGAKVDADKAGDKELISELEGKIASMQTQINTMEQELKVMKQKALEVIEDTVEKTVRMLSNVV